MALVLNGDGEIGGLVVGGLPNGSVAQADLASGVAGNGPAFAATASGNQSITSGTNTKINFDTTSFNLNSNYNTSTYRFTPTVAGYYQINASLQVQTVNTSCVATAIIFKNGGVYMYGPQCPATSNNYPIAGVAGLVYLNGSTDYVELYAISVGVSATVIGFNFQGVLVRAA
jgi:hypothetical protein